ncbi:hypothetical protein N657DRAFT_594641 [Parathielavia appendiculata]|uniref:Uncharacterized protein n=1 Tax=Parathielavia appendiculata TaxID=2587402 RepID=A0AAN6U0J0_9PEZI|nr:hypothetical protein N657DRAFT_594641 [Parathielavia appendiculata]
MKFSATSIAAMVATLASTGLATVFTGTRTGIDGSQAAVAWTNGTPDLCSGFGKIVDGTGNPCGRDFFVDGSNGPFRLEGCGGAGLTLFRSGQFNANCRFQQRTFNCPGGARIRQDWVC